MKISRSIFLWVSCLLFAGNISAQAQENLLELTRRVTKTAEVTKFKSKNVHLKYIQTSTTRNRMDLPESTEVEIKMKGDKQIMLSQQMDVYMDGKEAYVVYKEARKIFKMKDIQAVKSQMSNSNMTKAMELLWETAKITEITPPQYKTARILKIIPSKEMQEVSKVARVDIVFDRNSQKLQKITMFMEEKSYLRKMEFKYLIIEENDQIEVFDSARSKIYDASQKLLKKYKGYTIQEV
ncbi:MAG: hypothetical protein COB67_06960 [SAR324 cluster bacterium]|uniref:Outer membrane lipoprotein carrier protein LolA n=1 Tax=SAR324 cluster bacterium TaxID=2024889 RepID=A0A2A4T3L8_9DELT|nr:MAG: hypothetical protein COB67_06960 [SAR324 cluster bacterium]